MDPIILGRTFNCLLRFLFSFVFRIKKFSLMKNFLFACLSLSLHNRNECVASGCKPGDIRVLPYTEMDVTLIARNIFMPLIWYHILYIDHDVVLRQIQCMYCIYTSISNGFVIQRRTEQNLKLN